MTTNITALTEMMNKRDILICLVCLVAGFFVGRATIKTKETVKYVKGETVTRTIRVPEVRTIEVPKLLYYPQKPIVLRDSTVVYVTDTVKVFEEYSSINHYDFNVFDDENGRLDVKQSLQYNKIRSFDYSYTPTHKVVTRSKERAFVPFISTSYSTLNYVGIGGGVFVKDLGIEYSYLHNFGSGNNGHLFGVKYRF